jgi:acetylornithine deacetylase
VWRDGKLYGLGSNDAKGCVAAMLLAARALLENPHTLEGRGEVVFAFTAEEETGGAGLGTVLPALGALDAAIVGEPTGLKPCTAQRGLLLLRCVAQGKSAHVAHAHTAGAENAIHVAARDISVLAELRFPAHPLLGEARAQVTQIQGGLARNQVPDRCEFFVDLRTTPGMDHAAVAQQLAGALRSEVMVHSARYLPKFTPEHEPIVRAAVAAGGASPVGSSTASDWAFLGKVPTVKVGPGDTLRSHRPDEYLALVELEAGVAFYQKLIHGYFSEAARG